MKAFQDFFSGVAQSLNPKKGSFSGAMDVIVVLHPNGTLISTPFYIKFGRFKLAKSKNKKVDLIVNGFKTDIGMELNSAGIATFYKDIEGNMEPNEGFLKNQEKPNIFRPESLRNSKFGEKISSLIENEKLRHLVQQKPEINLSSEELKLLDLKFGLNIVKYALQSKKKIFLSAKIYLWDYRNKIIISDIDGTVSKSDMLGHIFYLMGKDWKREGVISLYKKMRKKGYQIVYLSARSIDQMDYTRGYLSWVSQNNEHLPDGPVILSPNGLFTTFVREVSNTVHCFKQMALTEILNCFPLDFYPFFAGFGNKKGDALAYVGVGLEKDKVFIFKDAKKNEEFFKAIKHFNEVLEEIESSFPEVDDYILL